MCANGCRLAVYVISESAAHVAVASQMRARRLQCFQHAHCVYKLPTTSTSRPAARPLFAEQVISTVSKLTSLVSCFLPSKPAAAARPWAVPGGRGCRQRHTRGCCTLRRCRGQLRGARAFPQRCIQDARHADAGPGTLLTPHSGLWCGLLPTGVGSCGDTWHHRLRLASNLS